ncbi:MAG: kelch repeat-containing protein [Acidimicrobiales bacterium]
MLDDLSPARKIAYAVLGLFSLIALFAAFGSGDSGVDTTAPKATRSPSTTGGVPATTVPVPKAFDKVLLTVKLPTATSRSAAVPDGKGGFYLLGGLDVRRAPMTSILRVDPVANSTLLVGSLTQPVQNHAAVAIGERVLLYGGGERAGLRDIQEYKGVDNAAVAGQLAIGRYGHSAVSVGGRIVIVGGSDGIENQTEVLASADGITFTAIANLPVGLRFAAVAGMNNKVYVFGGEVNDKPVSTVYAIDLTNGAVTEPAKLDRPVSHASAFVVNGGVFFAGGKTDKGLTDFIWRFDTTAATPTFKFAGTLPRAVSDAAAVTVGSKVFLAGGESPSFVQDVVQLTPLADDSGLLAQLSPSTVGGGSPLPQATVPPRAVVQPATTTTRATTTRPTTTAPAPTAAPTTTAPPTTPSTTPATTAGSPPSTSHA